MNSDEGRTRSGMRTALRPDVRRSGRTSWSGPHRRRVRTERRWPTRSAGGRRRWRRCASGPEPFARSGCAHRDPPLTELPQPRVSTTFSSRTDLMPVEPADDLRRGHEDDHQALDDRDDVDRDACHRLHLGCAAPQEAEQQRGQHHAERVALAQRARWRWRRSRSRPRSLAPPSGRCPSTWLAPPKPAKPPLRVMASTKVRGNAHAGVTGGVGVRADCPQLEADRGLEQAARTR